MARNGGKGDHDDTDEGGVTIARMAAKDDGGGDPLSVCIQGCSDKTEKVDEFLSCVRVCKAILGLQAGSFSGGGRIVIIG